MFCLLKLIFIIQILCFKLAINDIECGVRSKYTPFPNSNCKLNNRVPRIVSGSDAPIYEFPWMSSIFVENHGYCGAVIIHKLWILSAAHCLYPNVATNQIHVRIGSNDKLRGKRIGVKQLFIHPEYLKNKYIIYDMALIQLQNDISFNSSFANRVCGPLNDDPIDRPELTLFAGWGQISTDGRQPTNTLKKAYYYTLPTNQCKYKSKHFICVNATEGVGCAGDSGSPLIRYSNCKAFLLGIFSYAERHTNQRCGPALMLFVRVSKHIQWIESLTGSLKNTELNIPTLHTTDPNIKDESNGSPLMPSLNLLNHILLIILIVLK